MSQILPGEILPLPQRCVRMCHAMGTVLLQDVTEGDDGCPTS